MLKAGDYAPDFILKDQNDAVFDSKQLAGKPFVLFFYPKDHSPGCTAEVCSFRDAYAVFQDHGAEVIGVSVDSTRSHKNFARRFRVPFRLLSDPVRKVQRLFGVANTSFGISYNRVTFVVNAEGLIVKVFDSAFFATSHIRMSMKALQLL